MACPPDQADDVPPEETAEHAALAMLALTDEIEPLLTYAWRRHLYAALGRMLADAGPDQPESARSGWSGSPISSTSPPSYAA